MRISLFTGTFYAHFTLPVLFRWLPGRFGALARNTIICKYQISRKIPCKVTQYRPYTKHETYNFHYNSYCLFALCKPFENLRQISEKFFAKWHSRDPTKHAIYNFQYNSAVFLHFTNLLKICDTLSLQSQVFSWNGDWFALNFHRVLECSVLEHPLCLRDRLSTRFASVDDVISCS